MKDEDIKLEVDEGVEVGEGQSPIPLEVPSVKITDIKSPFAEPKNLNFYEAIKEIVEGKKVTKIEWDEKEYYGLLDKGILKLHKSDGKLYNWIISDGDIAGTDYVIIN